MVARKVITRNREDYLKTIYKLNLEQEKTTNKDIASILKVSPSSASEMLKKMLHEELIQIVDGDVRLTSYAKDKTRDVLSKHRLWELFLIEYLGFDWTEVHEQAELLEHATTKILKERLNQFLNYPKFCPHGELIYENHDHYIADSLSLYQVSDTALYEVNRVADDKRLLDYLTSLKIHLKSKVRVISFVDYDESYIVEVDGKEVNIAKKALYNIFVNKVEE